MKNEKAGSADIEDGGRLQDKSGERDAESPSAVGAQANPFVTDAPKSNPHDPVAHGV